METTGNKRRLGTDLDDRATACSTNEFFPKINSARILWTSSQPGKRHYRFHEGCKKSEQKTKEE
jgi:hypothetical protein